MSAFTLRHEGTKDTYTAGVGDALLERGGSAVDGGRERRADERESEDEERQGRHGQRTEG